MPGAAWPVGRAERGTALVDATSAAHAAGDLLTALGHVIPEGAATAALREHLRGVAEVCDRAARIPQVGQPVAWSAPAQALRTAARQLAAVQVISVRGSDAEGAVMLLAALATLASRSPPTTRRRRGISKPPRRDGRTVSWWPRDRSTPDPAGARHRLDPGWGG
jgi:hypothetical protein